MKTANRRFLIKDLDCEIIIETIRRKDFLDYLEEYIENLDYEWFDGSDSSYCILYKDGSFDMIDEDYDGHKIKKQNIVSAVYNNPCSYMVYGNFEMNEYGVVTTSVDEIIADTNIAEIK